MAQAPGEKHAAQGVAAGVWCHTGKAEKAVEALTGLIAVGRAAGFISGALPHMHFLCEGYLLAGDFDKAAETARELLELAERCGARGYIGKAHRLLGEVALKTDPNEAASHFERAIAIFRETKAENELALACAGMGRFLKQQGKTDQARDYLGRALDIFERLGTLVEPDKVRQELAEASAKG